MIQFYVIEYDGGTPPANLSGRKDVILVEPNSSAKFITTFSTFSDPTIPYMYHCHILPHEDAGMMGQFIVVDSTLVGIDQSVDDVSLTIRPNPARDQLYIDGAFESLEIYDMLGRLRLTESISPISVADLEPGIYVVRTATSSARFVKD
jgi:bilirubin oxidase